MRLVEAWFLIVATQLTKRWFVRGGNRDRAAVDGDRHSVEPPSEVIEDENLGTFQAVCLCFLEM